MSDGTGGGKELNRLSSVQLTASNRPTAVVPATGESDEVDLVLGALPVLIPSRPSVDSVRARENDVIGVELSMLAE